MRYKLKDGNNVVESDSGNYKYKLFGDPGVEISENVEWGELTLGAVNKAIVFIASLTALLMLTYSFLSSTLLFYTPTENGLKLVATSSFDRNQLPASEIAVLSPTRSKPSNFIDNATFGWGNIENKVIGRIVAPNYSLIENKDGFLTATTADGLRLTINGSYSGPVNFRLSDQYLVECLEGACNKGEIYAYRSNQVYGLVKGY